MEDSSFLFNFILYGTFYQFTCFNVGLVIYFLYRYFWAGVPTSVCPLCQKTTYPDKVHNGNHNTNVQSVPSIGNLVGNLFTEANKILSDPNGMDRYFSPPQLHPTQLHRPISVADSDIVNRAIGQLKSE